ncbi:alpha/beta hydrolase [Aestuariirhabdus sp. Z084]|uniref:alpha/beta hydrolase n=1 Tax=Aestuariirhabdus haliotis TaxID=2918751 RepID=UPI00201B3B86|nr:alpha/beta hydrolase [Aestuariirhabdus haliotis]MCL6415526.1 alpha/beta hydrolase [Aestuariirhabdus haliotis]MCL6419269.1 alpha/beta hydrolase [Aestuariirhabdus haliotis]
MSYLPCIEIEPEQPATSAVIWLHGLGASGHDFEPIVPELGLPESMAVRFVFPHAPQIPVTINGGMVMPAWYDILSMDIDRKIDQSQIMQSANAITALIEREIERGIDSQRILLAGFSQGGAVAYQTALSYDKPLAGLMALSTYLATHETLERSEANRQLPMIVDHGMYDPVVPEALGKHAVAVLQSWGYAPEYRTYPMEHQVCPQQIGDISRWLQKVLG